MFYFSVGFYSYYNFVYFFYNHFIIFLGTRDTIDRTLETVGLKTVGEGAWPQLAFMMKGQYTNIEVKKLLQENKYEIDSDFPK